MIIGYIANTSSEPKQPSLSEINPLKGESIRAKPNSCHVHINLWVTPNLSLILPFLPKQNPFTSVQRLAFLHNEQYNITKSALCRVIFYCQTDRVKKKYHVPPGDTESNAPKPSPCIPTNKKHWHGNGWLDIYW